MPVRDGRIRVLVASLAAALAGCAAYMHGYTHDRFVHRTLSPQTEDGRYRLDLESKVDVSVRNYIADHGEPDYLRVADVDGLYLYYLDEDLVAEFRRSFASVNSDVTPHQPIPEDHIAWLPRDAASRLAVRAPAEPTPLDACFGDCRRLTDRTKEQCFDACRD